MLDKNICFRKISMGPGPKTIDEEARSVFVVAATESKVRVYDWDRGSIDEIILMSGVTLPENNQLPLLDAHNRYGTDDVIGSFRNIKIGKKDMTGTAVFSSLAEDVWTKVREGHLTDFSIGYVVNEAQYAEEGESVMIDGRKFKGPVKVVTKSTVKELSSVPIGADDKAKSRQYQDDERKNTMPDNEEIKKEETRADTGQEKALEKIVEVRTETVIEKESPEEIERRAEARALEIIKNETEIREMCRKVGKTDADADKFIEEKKTFEEVSRSLFAEMGKDQEEKTGEGFGFARAYSGTDALDKFREGAVQGLLQRAGLKPPDFTNEYQGMRLMDAARRALSLNNMSTHGSETQIIDRAMSTSDFPFLLSDSANKTVFDKYQETPETFELWTGESPAKDFKRNELPRLGMTGSLDEVTTEGAEGKHGSRDEAVTYYTLREFLKIWTFTRRNIINDDTGMLKMLADYGAAAKRTAGDVAYEVLTANLMTTDAGDVAIFSTTNGNLEATLTQGPDVDSLNAADLAMALQKDINGLQTLNINPIYFIAPRALKGGANVFFNSTIWKNEATIGTVDEAVAATRNNPWSGGVLTPVYDTRLDANSSTAWYLAGLKDRTVNMVYLNGSKTPETNMWVDPETRAINISVGHDVAAHAVDYRWMFKNPGA